MNIVLFPSAKVVTQDLQGVGRFPAIIYPIEQMRMIDLFYNYYFEENTLSSRFEIVTYEAHDQVVRCVGNRNSVGIHKLDELRELGYTIYYGIKKACLSEEDTLIINFADVAVLSKIPLPICDRCYYAQEDISSKWTYFHQKDGKITEYYDKPESTLGVNTNNMLIGLFHIEKPLLLKSYLENAFAEEHEIDSLWIALKKYSEVRPFHMVCTDEWFDIGHIDKYYNMQMAIKSRTFNHIVIDKNRGILTKTSDDKDKFIGEIQWYLKLPTDVEYARPRIFSYSTEYTNPYISMEYYSYHTLHELFLYGDLSEEQWSNVFRRIRFILNDFRRYSVRDDGISFALREMYIDKTVNRLQSMQDDKFVSFNEPLVINGKTYASICNICEKLPEIIDKTLLDIAEFHIIHGDLCFANIMIDPNLSFIKLIDPRGKFGKYDIYGDRRYELAKLMHSIDGKYDYIIKDKFDLSSNENRITYEIRYDQNVDIVKCFEKIFEEEILTDRKSIKLIESLLFFSMIPLHKESRKRQTAMLATAVRLLDEVLPIQTNGGNFDE